MGIMLLERNHVLTSTARIGVDPDGDIIVCSEHKCSNRANLLMMMQKFKGFANFCTGKFCTLHPIVLVLTCTGIE